LKIIFYFESLVYFLSGITRPILLAKPGISLQIFQEGRTAPWIIRPSVRSKWHQKYCCRTSWWGKFNTVKLYEVDLFVTNLSKNSFVALPKSNYGQREYLLCYSHEYIFFFNNRCFGFL